MKENWEIIKFFSHTRKICYVDNKIHKLDGPAVIDYIINNDGNEIILKELWYKNDKQHRDGNKPASMIYYEDGKVKEVKYFVGNKIHKENGAAVVGFYRNGKICYMKYFKNGKLSNAEKPSTLEFDKNGILRFQAYCLNGECHRENGPALEIFDSYGNISKVEYYINGALHRIDGPAVISYSSQKRIEEVSYFINGIYIKKNEYDKLVEKIQNKSIIKSVNRYKKKKFNIIYQMVKYYGDKDVIEVFDNKQIINNLSL